MQPLHRSIVVRSGAPCLCVELRAVRFPLTRSSSSSMLRGMEAHMKRCPHCKAEWENRKDHPLRCPRCSRPLVKFKRVPA